MKLLLFHKTEVLMSIKSLAPLLNYAREMSIWVNYVYEHLLKMPTDLIHNPKAN